MVITCPKCRYTSGDDWRQCNGSCPMPASPYYNPEEISLGPNTYILWNAKLGGWLTRSSQWTSERAEAKPLTAEEAKETSALHNRGGLRVIPVRLDDLKEFGL